MMSTLNILGLHKRKPWQWKFATTIQDLSRCKQTVLYHSYTISTTCKPTVLHYCSICQNTASISARCSLQIRKFSDVSMSSQLAPNVWILTTAPSSAAATITLIFPGETTQFIEVKRPIHILCLPTVCSATSPNFHLPNIMKDHL